MYMLQSKINDRFLYIDFDIQSIEEIESILKEIWVKDLYLKDEEINSYKIEEILNNINNSGISITQEPLSLFIKFCKIVLIHHSSFQCVRKF